MQAHNGTVLTHQVRKTARLSQASVISHASYISKAGRRNSDTSSVHSKPAIKSFFKDMLRKLCPERPRYFNRPLDDKHGDSDQVCFSAKTPLNVDLYHAVTICIKTKQFVRLAYWLENHKNEFRSDKIKFFVLFSVNLTCPITEIVTVCKLDTVQV